jgi:hypothetical protein
MTHLGDQPDLARVQDVKRAYEAELLAKANVVGVGVGLRSRGGASGREVAIVVMVTRKVPRKQLAPADIVPNEIDGIPVDVQEVGEIKAL